MSNDRKANQRSRLRAVDSVIATLNTSLTAASLRCKALTRAIDEVLPEADMESRDKYTIFSKSSVGYRKGIHKMAKFTRVSTSRVSPKGF